jgi:hypothetical protein
MFARKNNNKIVVKLDELPALTEQEQFNMFEIDNKNVISRISVAVPGVVQALANTAVAAKGIDLANSGVYVAKLPSGAQFVKSKEIQNAVRGFYRDKTGIKGHADFLPVDVTMEEIANINLTSAVMGAASLVVGQYYMKQINIELSEVNSGINRISEFQDNEYKSKVLALMTQVKRMSDFKTEILENSDIRKEEIIRLQTMEKECMELLGQANLTIEQLSGSEHSEFEGYLKKVTELTNWQQCQKGLIEILYMISDLNYVLHLGALSNEQAYTAYESMYKQTKKTIERMQKWHSFHGKKFGIDTDRAILERRGLDALIHKPLGLINESHNYRNLSRQEVVNIRNQVNAQIENKLENKKDLYQEDVKVVIKDGKLFYMIA